MSLTGANTIIVFSINGLFPVPQQLQGFDVDDVFDTDAIESAQVRMGVDGKMSAGFVFVEVKQNFALQADSPSIDFFDSWWAAQQVARVILRATAVVTLTEVGKKWTMTNGVLTSYKPIPDTKKLLQAQKFQVTWESMFPAII